MGRDFALEHPLLAEGQPVEPVLPAVEKGARSPSVALLDWRQAVGGLLIVAGLVTILVAWFGVSGTTSTTAQLSYMTSGGLGGVGLILVGALFFVSFEHARDRSVMAELDARLRHLEEGLAGELDVLYETLGTARRNGVK